MHLSSTRKAIHDALAWGHLHQGAIGMGEYLVYLTRIEKSIRQSDPCVDFLEAAYICAAINSLKAPLSGWLTFCYGQDEQDTVQRSLASQMRFKLFPTTPAGTPMTKTKIEKAFKNHERYKSLCYTALEDYRLRVNRNTSIPNALYSERMGVHSEHWARDWKGHQDKCLGEVAQWDSEGVGRVSSMVKALRDGEHRPTEVLNEMRT